jgi:probable rRNA maturation factor
MIQVEITDLQRRVRVSRPFLRNAVRQVLLAEDVEDADVSLVLATDARMASVNERYLHHRGPTDVITFPYSEPGETPLVCEILVSVETAARVAGERGHALPSEVALYVVHGLLHACGFDDHAPADRRRMRRREAKHLKALNVALKG